MRVIRFEENGFLLQSVYIHCCRDKIYISKSKNGFIVKKFVPDQWAEKYLKMDGDNGKK